MQIGSNASARGDIATWLAGSLPSALLIAICLLFFPRKVYQL